MPTQSKPERKASLYSKGFLAKLMVDTNPDDFKELLCRGDKRKFWRHVVWELVLFFYGRPNMLAAMDIQREHFNNELVLMPFIDSGVMAQHREAKNRWLQAMRIFFYTSFTALARAVVDWYAERRRDDKKRVFDMPHSELPQELVHTFQTAVVYRSTWLAIIRRFEADEKCIWYEYVHQYIPQLYERKRVGVPDPVRLLDLCIDVVAFTLDHHLSDGDIEELWDTWRLTGQAEEEGSGLAEESSD